MSDYAINNYYRELENIIHYGGTKKETSIRNAFYHLLNEYAKQKGLMIVPEVTIKTAKGKNVTPDGTLKDTLRQDWGYWESKDEADNIDEEIAKKFAKGYPTDNILFEDSHTAVLFQNGNEVKRVNMTKAEPLEEILNAFMSYERPEVRNFRKAIELFKQDIPLVTETIRGIILSEEKTNPKFVKARNTFLKLCHDSINPAIVTEDANEMIIQHILTEDIFNTIFDETQFHRENNIARELETVINTFFTGQTRRVALSTVQHYYQAINAAAAGIADHHEKQKFLKVVYETFYKSYNPKAADRLGVVYTPNEIVRFMIESTDYLLHKHFNKFLADKNVEILDPATGTGTFICDIIDHLQKDKLEYKYKNEIHANEVAILPYYISNLNIEFTYTQKMGKYAEFENLCFVDTLDNMGFHYRGKQGDIFAPFTEENSKRIKNQNNKKIAVIIGNPPYNANQQNENDNNKNREYKEIDKRIKDTFVKYSTAQKTKVYDMYARFYRWAFDRLDNNGVIAFITNRSFIDSRTFDGFRKTIQREFDYAYIIDLGGDIRANYGKKGVSIGNVFDIQIGVAIMFLIKKQKRDNTTCQVQYVSLEDSLKKEQKLQWLAENSIKEISFEHIHPDKNTNWINISDNDFETLIPINSKNHKTKALFELASNGISTNRDEWVYDLSYDTLSNKGKYFIDEYNHEVKRWIKYKKENDYSDIKAEANPMVDKFLGERNLIKWSKMIKRDKLRKDKMGDFDINDIKPALYRPFVKQFLFFGYIPIDLKGDFENYFRNDNSQNKIICFSGLGSSKEFQALSANCLTGLDFLEKTKCIPLYRYDKNGNRIDNISDWGLNQFVKKYGKKGISKESIFYYTYAVLYNPAYRKKYELNLKREFPRIPFYKDFTKWANWGKALMDLHINYEKEKPFALKEVTEKGVENPKCRLKADKENGVIILDDATELTGVPKAAWKYKLGNRSALEWVLDQYKEKKNSDPTIAEKFNTYHFADYKDQVIDLLKRVCAVSVETMNIINQMEKESE